MDINKVDLLLKYILAAAGQEDYGNSEEDVKHGSKKRKPAGGRGSLPL